MRTQEQFEAERYFGIQKFSDPYEAFKVMDGNWGKNAEETQSALLVTTDESFRKTIQVRAIEKYVEYKEGKITWEECSRALGIAEKVTDYLLDFDFFLYSKDTKSYYTCRMSFKDDYVYLWNERQWGYYKELYDLYSFDLIVDKARKMVDSLYEENNNIDSDYILEYLEDEEDFMV